MKSSNEYNHERYVDTKQRNLKENKTKRKNKKQNLKHLVDTSQLNDEYIDNDDMFIS